MSMKDSSPFYEAEIKIPSCSVCKSPSALFTLVFLLFKHHYRHQEVAAVNIIVFFNIFNFFNHAAPLGWAVCTLIVFEE